ncbi:aminotransferase [Telmatospirillum sp.]|uniref:aminotransferase n=1 Tax=Telmatospirillum sp. TaxID=2079197 RepID=UPI00285237AF|nr:aminotransferase [Telmatospirillum sp.]MDR3435622.1 aminotransferase [Telmatospirillum sp.]
MKAGNSVLSGYGTTIFEVMSRLANQHGAINLGQGFPEGLEPPALIAAAKRALSETGQQYPSMMGTPALRQAVSDHDRRFYGLAIDPDNEVMVTSGGTEALADCLFGLIEPGDEVVLIEPLYDAYLPIVRRAGGVARLVRLEPPDWKLPRQALEAAFSAKTKLMILNNPMNPTGKMFPADDLAFIASLLARFDAYCVCDEVYEHLIYDGRPHIPLATLPGMRERCLRIGSAGKTFSLTGWKVGYLTACPALLQPVAKAHQYITFTTPPNLQQAVAEGLASDDIYYRSLAGGLQARRDKLAAGLADIGFTVLPCSGSYFLTADFRPLGFVGDDTDFCKHITVEAGVTAVPVSIFYEAGDIRHYARFCFAKKDEALDEALSRLKRHFAQHRR